MAFEEPTLKYPLSKPLARLLGYENGVPVIGTTQTVDQFIEEATYYRNYHPRNGYNQRRDFQFVAQIPKEMVSILYRRCYERGIKPAEWFASSEFIKWLNSEEARPWRTSSGTV